MEHRPRCPVCGRAWEDRHGHHELRVRIAAAQHGLRRLWHRYVRRQKTYPLRLPPRFGPDD